MSASGTLTVADVDAGQQAFKVHDMTAALRGDHGTLTIDSAGHWIHTLANGATDIQALDAGEA